MLPRRTGVGRIIVGKPSSNWWALLTMGSLLVALAVVVHMSQ